MMNLFDVKHIVNSHLESPTFEEVVKMIIKLYDESKDLDPEYNDILNENFWELI
jgi:hypothetical protein